ncbi:MAG: N-acetylmuramoyl-L-alanine amidase [Bifidobacteriaceae bacterium]|jgi:hypothetical protein|nr:N-acetylmuramoyl-L-alanine amidase [Bifidobacteriaceae bacterium]
MIVHRLAALLFARHAANPSRRPAWIPGLACGVVVALGIGVAVHTAQPSPQSDPGATPLSAVALARLGGVVASAAAADAAGTSAPNGTPGEVGPGVSEDTSDGAAGGEVDQTQPVDVPLPRAEGGIQRVPLSDIVGETEAAGAVSEAAGAVSELAPGDVAAEGEPAADAGAGSGAAEPTDAGGVRYTTMPVSTDSFAVAGVTWDPADEPESVRLRAFVDGGWTDWQALEVAARSGGPAPDSPEGLQAVGGTEPFVALGASGVQVELVAADQSIPSSWSAELVSRTSDDAAAPAPFGRSAGRLVAAGTDPGEVEPAGAAVREGTGSDGSVAVDQAGGRDGSSILPTDRPSDPASGGDGSPLEPGPGQSATPTETPAPPASPSPSPTAPTQTPTVPPAPPEPPAPPAPPAPVDPPPEPDLLPAPSEPTIITRDEWGAPESKVKQKPRYFGKLRGAVVHHTAGSNSYTQEQVPSVVRGIFNYHVGSLKWNDIGYNFLVDKYGGIWEGRAGGITSNVIGAHANHFNSETFGVSLLGNYEDVEPTPEAIAALSSIVSWRLAVGGIYDPSATTTYATNDKTMPVIIGHKDATYWRGKTLYNATSCPGQYLYPYLDTLRTGEVYPVVNRPGISGPADVDPGKVGTYTLTWDSNSGPVTGTVEVQRSKGSGWTSMGNVNVVSGVAHWQLRPSGVYTYRAVARSVASPAGWRLPPKTTSTSVVTTRVISRAATRTPRLFVPSYAPAGKTTTAVALWENPYDSKPAKLELQIRKGKKWVRVKNITVNGIRFFKIKVNSAAKYRLKAHKKSAPARGKLRASKSAKIRVWS